MWSQKDYPLIEVGEIELNRNPDNYFADVEQAAFTPVQPRPGHLVLPGQDAAGPAVLLRRRSPLPARRQPPPDPGQLPRRAALVNSYHRDGKMRVDGNLGGVASFNPNNVGLWDNQPAFADPPLPIGSTRITTITATTTTLGAAR